MYQYNNASQSLLLESITPIYLHSEISYIYKADKLVSLTRIHPLDDDSAC